MSPPIVRDPDSQDDAPEREGTSRRGFLGGLATALAAAALIRPSGASSERVEPTEAPRLPRWIGHY